MNILVGIFYSYKSAFTWILKGANNVMVIIIGNEVVVPSSNPGQDCLHFI